ncbi:MAG: flagellar export chaperone FliS [Porticoccaceae bacterium]|nr:flagellar export chaperone FliS [Porticoccaceae bacterium]
MSNTNTPVQQYRTILNQSAVADASPYQLTAMLFAGVLDNLAAAKGGIERDNVALKGEKIGRAIEIIDNLRATLNMEVGGAVAENLRDLYDYMETRLLRANIDSDAAMIDEVAALMIEIKLGWDGIPEDQRDVSIPNAGGQA